MEVGFLVRVSALMDFFLSRKNVSSFVDNEAPETDEIGI